MFIEFPEVTGLTVNGMDDIPIPRMRRIRQIFDAARIENLAEHLRAQMDEVIPNKGWYAGKEICVTVGSRGIPHLDLMVKTLCDQLKHWGAKPFLIPAMGSHGGATAQGQLEVLSGYGITEESMGVPIRSSMEVRRYGQLDDGTPLYCDRFASLSDGIVLLNKVKPHTDFRGRHESGLAKMIAIGIAKHKGAAAFHQHDLSTFPQILPPAAAAFMRAMPVAFGVGVVQNAYDDICALEVARAEEIMDMDARLLELAKQRMARFKFSGADVLIVDEIGKQFSGYGHDPNVTGRTNGGDPGFTAIFNVKRMMIRDLSPASHHNGSGIAEADVTTRRCLNAIDWGVTWTNLTTSTKIQGCRIPMYANNDLQALRLAIVGCGNTPPDQLKVVRIRNTLSLDEIEVSEALYNILRGRPGIEPVGEPFEYRFDGEGNLL